MEGLNLNTFLSIIVPWCLYFVLTLMGAFLKDIYNTLIKVEKELATTISSIDIWKLNGENFEIVTKMRELKDSIEDIKAQCKQNIIITIHFFHIYVTI